MTRSIIPSSDMGAIVTFFEKGFLKAGSQVANQGLQYK